MRTGIFIAMLFMVAVGTAFAQAEQQKQAEDKASGKSYMYQWTDDKGVVHITDELGKVPRKYRDKARKLESKKEDEADQTQQQKISEPPRVVDEEGIEEQRKAEWQQRMSDARKRLADAEKRYRELDQKRTELLGAWGGVAAYATPEYRLEAERLAEEMKTVQKEIDDARNMLENVIPEEARKAGVPPGWLRE